MMEHTYQDLSMTQGLDNIQVLLSERVNSTRDVQ